MRRRRYTPDSSISTVDMLFNVLLFFFLTTVLSVKARSLADDVKVPGADDAGAPVVVRLEAPATDAAPARFSLQSPGQHAPPASDAEIPGWLAGICGATATAGDEAKSVIVQVECTDTTTHAQCKGGVRDLWQRAPRCDYQY
jgi:hypothetical protein